MAKSPLAELREMNVSKQREARAADPRPAPDAPADTYLLTQVSKYLSKDLSTQVSKPLSEELGEEVLTPSSDPGQEAPDHGAGGGETDAAPARPSPRRGPKTRPAGGTAAGYAGVKDRLQAGAGKEPLVRLSVDVTESLHTRLKQYTAAQRIPSSRMLIVTLLEDFLDSEGF